MGGGQLPQSHQMVIVVFGNEGREVNPATTVALRAAAQLI
jgi:hypothetical protein